MKPLARLMLVGMPMLTEACLGCGAGTVRSDKQCVLDTDLGAGLDTDVALSDTDPASDTDSTTPGSDSDATNDSALPTGTCAPPDRWTGPVPRALYTTAPYDPTYDAGLGDINARIGSSSGSGSSSQLLIDGATVVWVYVPPSGDWNIVLSDGVANLSIAQAPTPLPAIGDRVSAITRSVRNASGTRSASLSAWHSGSTGNPVYVASAVQGLDYLDRFAQVVHMWGEIAGPSAVNCGTGFACFRVEHDGRMDLIRLPVSNSFGLNADYPGGLCGEMVAPIGFRYADSGDATFLDITEPDAMRVWTKP